MMILLYVNYSTYCTATVQCVDVVDQGQYFFTLFYVAWTSQKTIDVFQSTTAVLCKF